MRKLAERIRETKGAFTVVVLDHIDTDSELELETTKSKYVLEHQPVLNTREMAEPSRSVQPKKKEWKIRKVDLTSMEDDNIKNTEPRPDNIESRDIEEAENVSDLEITEDI